MSSLPEHDRRTQDQRLCGPSGLVEARRSTAGRVQPMLQPRRPLFDLTAERGEPVLPNRDQASMLRTSIAGLLTWAVPGLGHSYMGHRGRGALHRSLDRAGAPNPVGHWLTTDIGVHYTGVAGLLTLLVILDAIGRADRPGPNGRGKPRAPGAVP